MNKKIKCYDFSYSHKSDDWSNKVKIDKGEKQLL